MTQPTGIYSMEHNGLYVGRGVSATPHPAVPVPVAGGLQPRSPACLENPRDIPPSALVPVSCASSPTPQMLSRPKSQPPPISSPLMNAVAGPKIRKPGGRDGIGFRRVSSRGSLGIARGATWIRERLQVAACNSHVMTFFRSDCGKLGAHLILP
ncbi:unnamed protein product [Lasius platythorax]|uniref:Uncharacterized protein n=1 Tax=Lasius platythorax TaxID=488582 RepID=A0AAV2P9A1_9HYME